MAVYECLPSPHVDFDAYQHCLFWVHNPRIDRLTYSVLGMCGEAGEAAEAYKKMLRKDYPDQASKDAVILELGDVLWYVAKVASELGVSLSEVARRNLEKLAERQLHGKEPETL